MRRAPGGAGPHRATAIAPGHVTGLFAPARTGTDPRARGSVGAGLVLEVGVEASATFWPNRPSRLHIQSDVGLPLTISAEVARRLLAGPKGRLELHLTHALPVGQGFGMSAAGALATALAVAAVTGIPRQRAIEVAHLADLFGGGGLGGVSAILGGGLEVRERPGVPPYGRVRHRPFRPSILLTVSGPPIPSQRLLRDPAFLERVKAAAQGGLREVRAHPSPTTFLDASERFTDALHLAPPSLVKRIRSLRASGGWVAQAMFGHSLFAVAPDRRSRASLLRAFRRYGSRVVELNAAQGGPVVVRQKRRRG